MRLQKDIEDAHTTLDSLLGMEAQISDAARLIGQALTNGNTILVCGNGGSAAQGQHFVTELVGRYRLNRRSLPAIFLGGDVGQMSCIANDFDWDQVFARPLRAFARPGDVLLCFSTSGASSNVVRALKAAEDLGLTRVALLGKDGGAAANLATHAMIVDSDSTARIQEAHLFFVHWICEYLERLFQPDER
jgi:D-sedoheptulose 7-phosphate isomerase